MHCAARACWRPMRALRPVMGQQQGRRGDLGRQVTPSLGPVPQLSQELLHATRGLLHVCSQAVRDIGCETVERRENGKDGEAMYGLASQTGVGLQDGCSPGSGALPNGAASNTPRSEKTGPFPATARDMRHVAGAGRYISCGCELSGHSWMGGGGGACAHTQTGNPRLVDVGGQLFGSRLAGAAAVDAKGADGAVAGAAGWAPRAQPLQPARRLAHNLHATVPQLGALPSALAPLLQRRGAGADLLLVQLVVELPHACGAQGSGGSGMGGGGMNVCVWW